MWERGSLRRAIALSALLVASGCGTQTHGTVDVTDVPELGTRRALVVGCHQTASGVELDTDGDMTLQVSDDPLQDGTPPEVDVLGSDAARVALAAAACSTFDVSVRPDGNCAGNCNQDGRFPPADAKDGSGHEDVDGHVEATCSPTGGGSIEIHVNFSYCQ